VGDQGPAGAPGTTAVTHTATEIMPPNSEVDQIALDNLPGSRYLAMAKVNARSQSAGSTVECRIEAPGNVEDEATWTNTVNDSRGVLWMVMPTENEVDEVKVVCSAGTSSANLRTTLTLIPAL
jgi:hypothetical protein